MSQNPCEMRVSNGMGCARKYGHMIAETQNRVPTTSESYNHLEGNKFSKQHWEKNLLPTVRNAAIATLKNNRQDVCNQLSDLALQFEAIFIDMGYSITVFFSENAANYKLKLTFNGISALSKMAAHDAYKGRYVGDSIQDLFAQLATDRKDYAEKELKTG